MRGILVRDNLLYRNMQIKKPHWGRLLFAIIIFVYILSGCSIRRSRIYRVGILSGLDAFLDITAGYKAKMTELGYVEGKNIEYDYWKLNDDCMEEQRIIRKFVDEKVDLILTFPTRPSAEAKAATQETNIPVVFANAGIEETNLVNSLPEPGGNITGVRYPIPEITFKRLELLLELVPDAHTIYIIYDSNYPNHTAALNALHEAAQRNNLELVEKPVTTVEELTADLDRQEKMADLTIDAIFIMPDLLTGSKAAWEKIQPFAEKHKMPVAGTMDFQLDDAGLFLLMPDYYDMGRLAATITDKIFQGIPPGTIPVVSPNLQLYINYRRAKELGLSVPEGLLKQAFRVIH
jgi:putative ABC transport system substrate-binding protein